MKKRENSAFQLLLSQSTISHLLSKGLQHCAMISGGTKHMFSTEVTGSQWSDLDLAVRQLFKSIDDFLYDNSPVSFKISSVDYLKDKNTENCIFRLELMFNK